MKYLLIFLTLFLTYPCYSLWKKQNKQTAKQQRSIAGLDEAKSGDAILLTGMNIGLRMTYSPDYYTEPRSIHNLMTKYCDLNKDFQIINEGEYYVICVKK